MAEQEVITPLIEEDVELAPAFNRKLTLLDRVRRTWSLLFGRSDAGLRAVYVGPGGHLAVGMRDFSRAKSIVTGTLSGSGTANVTGDFLAWCNVGGVGYLHVWFRNKTTSTPVYPMWVTSQFDATNLQESYTAGGIVWGRFTKFTFYLNMSGYLTTRCFYTVVRWDD